MSGSSSCRTYDSEDESSAWLMSSEGSVIDYEDDLSDQLTLFNGGEDSDEDSTTFEDFIKLSIRLKKQYNLREASVALERCDKIWDTMQLVKNARDGYDGEETEKNEAEESNDETDKSLTLEKESAGANKPVPYILYQPTQGNGNNALPNFYLSVKSQKKVYHCATCGKIYSEKRTLATHVQKNHGISLPLPGKTRKRRTSTETRVTRSKIPQAVDTRFSNVDRGKEKEKDERGKESASCRSNSRKNPEFASYPCPMCENRYIWKSSLRKHAVDVHDFDIYLDSKEKCKKDGTKSENKDPEKDGKSGKNLGYRCRRISHRIYKYCCIPCGQEFSKKGALRKHAAREHGIIIPMAHSTRSALPKITEESSERDQLSSAAARRSLNNREDCPDAIRVTRERAGPESSKMVKRPKRACTVNTSYTECTAEDEETLVRGKLSSLVKPGEKIEPSRTIKCFLCKNSYVDIKRHLKDYHRISCPDSVLPLNEKMADTETEGIAEIGQPREKSDKERNFSIAEKNEFTTITSSFRDDKLLEAHCRRWIDERNGREYFQCLVCKYNYSWYQGAMRHLRNNVEDGRIKKHRAFQDRLPRDGDDDRVPTKDPVAPTNMNEKIVRKEEEEDDTSDENSSSCKRGSSFSDGSSSTSDRVTAKRRKIENFENRHSETYENNDTPPDLASDEHDHYDYGDGKMPIYQRDTRDSSDRDSGIGISITIKKRNDSYEVVDKDGYCAENKTEVYENIKDENFESSEFSSGVTSFFDRRNGNEFSSSRGSETFRSFDYGEESPPRNSKSIVDTMSRSFLSKEYKYCGEARSGQIPASLRILSTSLLRDELPDSMQNSQNSH